MLYDFSDIFITFNWIWNLDITFNIFEHCVFNRSLDHSVDILSLSVYDQLLLIAIFYNSLRDLGCCMDILAFRGVLRNFNFFFYVNVLLLVTSNISVEMLRNTLANDRHFNILCISFDLNFSRNRSWDILVNNAFSLSSLNFINLLMNDCSVFSLIDISLNLINMGPVFSLVEFIGHLLNLIDLCLIDWDLNVLYNRMTYLFIDWLLVSNVDVSSLRNRNFHMKWSLLWHLIDNRSRFAHQILRSNCLFNLNDSLWSWNSNFDDFWNWFVNDSFNVNDFLFVNWSLLDAFLDNGLAIESDGWSLMMNVLNVMVVNRSIILVSVMVIHLMLLLVLRMIVDWAP